MSTFQINCGQRGCVSTATGDKPPKLCPVCNQPLLKGNAVADAPPPPPPPPAPAPAPSQEN